MTLIWIIGAVIIGIVLLATLSLWHGRRNRADLGTLSERWMAEQRFRSFDPHR